MNKQPQIISVSHWHSCPMSITNYLKAHILRGGSKYLSPFCHSWWTGRDAEHHILVNKTSAQKWHHRLCLLFTGQVNGHSWVQPGWKEQSFCRERNHGEGNWNIRSTETPSMRVTIKEGMQIPSQVFPTKNSDSTLFPQRTDVTSESLWPQHSRKLTEDGKWNTKYLPTLL